MKKGVIIAIGGAIAIVALIVGFIIIAQNAKEQFNNNL